MRLLTLSRRTILQKALTITFMLAAPSLLLGQGKGGGKKGEEDPPTPPPETYLITWIDDFQGITLNEAGDLSGKIPSLGASSNYQDTFGIIYDGDRYVLNDFFAGTGTLPRILKYVSDRTTDGSVWMCGTCDTVDGIRGFRIKVSPTTDGLTRTSFSILQPAAGGDLSSLLSINIHGQAVGYSRNSADSLDNIYAGLYQDDLGQVAIAPSVFSSSYGGYEGKGQNLFVADSGEVTLVCYDEDGFMYVGSWMVGGPVQPIFYASSVNASELRLLSVSDLGEFLVRAWSESDEATYLYDGELSHLPEFADSKSGGIQYMDLNAAGDLASRHYTFGKGNKPGRYANEVYFAIENVTERLDNMLDSTNDEVDVDRWFGSEPRLRVMNNGGLISGQDIGSKSTFVLAPAP